VAVVEASRYDTWRAGETLSPGYQEILRGLGSSFGSGRTESSATLAVWGGPETYDNLFLFALRGNGWHVDCASFDARLCDSARNAGAETKRWFYSQEQQWPMSPFWQRRVNGDHSKWQNERN
jgi:hypothetical protein